MLRLSRGIPFPPGGGFPGGRSMGSSGKAKILYFRATPTGGSAGNSIVFLRIIIGKWTVFTTPAEAAFSLYFWQIRVRMIVENNHPKSGVFPWQNEKTHSSPS